MSAENGLSHEQREVLKALYPWYKEEVFRRREQMMWLTASASAVLILLLVMVPAIPALATSSLIAKVVMCGGVSVFYGLMAYLILQQRARHRMAKQVLIEIEREMGLYEEGRYLPDAALYPKEWQTAWQDDWSVPIYLAVVFLLAGLVIAAVLLRW